MVFGFSVIIAVIKKFDAWNFCLICTGWIRNHCKATFFLSKQDWTNRSSINFFFFLAIIVDALNSKNRKSSIQTHLQKDQNNKRSRGRVRRLTGVLEPSCEGGGELSSNKKIEMRKMNNISNVYMDTSTTSNACCMPCKMQHQSSLPSSPMSAFFHLSFNDEDDSHSSEEELEKINSKGMLQKIWWIVRRIELMGFRDLTTLW